MSLQEKRINAIGKNRTIVALIALCVCALTASICAAEAEVITVYAYHNKPPYMTDVEQRQGEYYDLVRFLNEQGDKYQFRLQYLPRNRIERLLAQNNLDGPLLGVNPVWFNDRFEQRYLWTQAVFHDQDIFVSRTVQPFEYTAIESTYGKQVCLVFGNYYFGLTEAIERGLLRKITTSREEVVLEMLDLKRCDFGVVSLSLYRFHQEQSLWKNQYHVAERPHDSFDRRMLVPTSLPAVHNDLQAMLQAWQLPMFGPLR